MRMMRWAGMVCLSLLAAGCRDGSAPRVTGRVAGTVDLGGAPLKSGVVILEDAKRGISSSAVVTDGRFAFTDPVDVGDFRVAIQPPPQPPPHEMPANPPAAGAAVVIPDQYVRPEKSGLTATVREGENDLPLKLDRTPRR